MRSVSSRRNCCRLDRIVFGRRQGESRGDEIGGVDDDVGVGGGDEVAPEERGRREQRHREGELTDDQAAGPAPRGHRSASPFAAVLQRSEDVGARQVQRRHQPEGERRQERDQPDEEVGGPVHRQIDPVGRRVGNRGAGIDDVESDGEQSRADAGHRHSDAPRHDGDQHALDQQLPDDPPAGSAERQPDRDFARAAGGARQQQRGEVGARHQQDERHCAHQRQEDRACALAQPVEQAFDGHRHASVGVGVHGRQAGGDAVDLAAGRADGPRPARAGR